MNRRVLLLAAALGAAAALALTAQAQPAQSTAWDSHGDVTVAWDSHGDVTGRSATQPAA